MVVRQRNAWTSRTLGRTGRVVAITACLGSLLVVVRLSTGEAGGSAGAGEMEQRGSVPRKLPFARGKSFDTLDAYLKHLKEMSKIDAPYYERIGPELYRKHSRSRPRPGAKVEFTRQELLEKFGFEK